MLLSEKYHPFFAVYSSVSNHCCFKGSLMRSGQSLPVAECFDFKDARMLAVLCNGVEVCSEEDGRFCVFTRHLTEMMPSLFDNLQEAVAYKASLEAEDESSVFGYCDGYRLGRVYV